MEQEDNIRKLVVFETDQKIAAAIGPAIRAEVEDIKREAMQEGGEVERYLGIITKNVLQVVREELGDPEKIAHAAVAIAKGEIAAEVARVQATVNAGGGPPGGSVPPVGGGGDGRGGDPQSDGQDPDRSAASAQTSAPGPDNERIGARVVDAIKRDPEAMVERGFNWLERAFELMDRRKNPFVEIERLRNDPTGIGAIALQSQTPGFADQANVASSIWSLGFKAGQGGKALVAATPPVPSTPPAPSSGQPMPTASGPVSPPTASAPVNGSPAPRSAESTAAMPAATAMATAQPSPPPQTRSEASVPPPSTFRMSDLA